MVRVYTNHGKKSSTHTNHEGKNHPNPWFVYTRTMERKVQPHTIREVKDHLRSVFFTLTYLSPRIISPDYE
jgi:hypothetical protein